MTKIISFLNEKGGVGKTTSVIEVAYHLGSQSKKVLVADLDPQANATQMLTGDRNHIPNLFDLFVDEDESIPFSKCLKSAKLAWKNVIVLPGDKRLQKLDTALSTRISRDTVLKNIISRIKDNFDIILFDLPPAVGIGTVNALVASTHYIIPTDRSEYSRNAINTIEKLVGFIKKAHNANLECAGIFMTGFEKSSSNAVKRLIDELDTDYSDLMLKIRVNHSVKIIESQQTQMPVGAFAPDCSVSKSYREIATLLNEV